MPSRPNALCYYPRCGNPAKASAVPVDPFGAPLRMTAEAWVRACRPHDPRPEVGSVPLCGVHLRVYRARAVRAAARADAAELARVRTEEYRRAEDDASRLAEYLGTQLGMPLAAVETVDHKWVVAIDPTAAVEINRRAEAYAVERMVAASRLGRRRE